MKWRSGKRRIISQTGSCPSTEIKCHVVPVRNPIVRPHGHRTGGKITEIIIISIVILQFRGLLNARVWWWWRLLLWRKALLLRDVEEGIVVDCVGTVAIGDDGGCEDARRGPVRPAHVEGVHCESLVSWHFGRQQLQGWLSGGGHP